MSNIFNYIDWRGDLSFIIDGFNEIDNLILSRLSYFPLDNLIKEKEEISIEEAYKRYNKSEKSGRILIKEDINLFAKLSRSERFSKIKLSEFVNKLDAKQEKQFSAITIILPDNSIYIAYRGTDNTVIGWKEDFNMCFSELVPSQVDAKEYLEIIADKYKKQKIRIGGHSKGGNLAVYAATFCKDKVQKRITNVYNNDGPGFCDKVVESEQYLKILDKVHTYIPQTSIIGRLLNHKEETTILKSTQTGIMQHDLYSWQVLGKKFVHSEITNSSEFIDNTVTNWLKEVDATQREVFVDTFFEILNTTQVETLSEFSSKKFANSLTMVKTYKNMNDKSKEIMIHTLSTFFQIAKNNINFTKPKTILKSNINKIKQKK